MCNHSSFFEKRKQFTSNDLIDFSSAQPPLIFLGKSQIARGLLAPRIQIVIKGVKRCENECQSQMELDIRREVTVCCILSGQAPNVHPILGTIELEQYLSPSPVFEYCENGTILEYIKKSEANHSIRLRLLKEIVEGINHIHNLGIIHGDLKVENVLIDDRNHARICDFGSAFVDECDCEAGCPENYQIHLTETYKSPELCMEEPFAPTIQSDIWAFGCLALRAQLGIFPYARQHFPAMRRMAQGHPPATPGQLESDRNPIAVAVAKIVQECWIREPAKRPGSQAILQQLNEAYGLLEDWPIMRVLIILFTLLVPHIGDVKPWCDCVSGLPWNSFLSLHVSVLFVPYTPFCWL
ncbi:kinase-like protein [Ceratobasidium sp. AG-I]|nr:kinase-like protein [Ceratobasidium sp. AG-I]